MRILTVSAFFPHPPLAGGQSYIWHLIRHLSPHAEVHLLSFTEQETPPPDTDGARAHCSRVEVVTRRPHPYPACFGHVVPQVVKDFFHPDMFAALDHLISEESYDVVHMQYTHMADYLLRCCSRPSPRPVCLLTELDIAFESLYRQARLEPWGRRKASLFWEYLKMLDYETRACPAADAVITVSERDRRQLLSFVPSARVECVPVGVDTQSLPFHSQPRDPETILFLGYMSHLPNVQALAHFYREVFPLVLQRRPSVRFQVVGSNAETELPRLAPDLHSALASDAAVELVGTVPDAIPYLHRASLMVVPVLFGAGVRVKIFESFAAGLPVVTTPLGAQGIPVRDREHLRFADSPPAMAEAITELLDRPDLGTSMAQRARRLVEEHCDYRVSAQRLLDLYRRMIDEKQQMR